MDKNSFNVLHFGSGGWRLSQTTSLGLKNPLLHGNCYVFLETSNWSRWRTEREDILKSLGIPCFLSTDTCKDMNGYFGCSPNQSETGRLESYSTWFQFYVKVILTEREMKQRRCRKDYLWYEMRFFSMWRSSGQHVMLCVGTPEKLESMLEAMLREDPPDLAHPLTLHICLISQIIRLHDQSVWRSREPIRKFEESRTVSGFNFEKLHDLSRHTIHIMEVLSVATETVERIMQQHEVVYSCSNSTANESYQNQAREYLSFQVQLLKSLHRRSISNHERLKAEITLAYHLITRQDNRVMKSIALLTMVFLPATFVSAFFSTTFFKFGDREWGVSEQLWVYWAVVGPATILVPTIWYLWLSYSARPLSVPYSYETVPWQRRPTPRIEV